MAPSLGTYVPMAQPLPPAPSTGEKEQYLSEPAEKDNVRGGGRRQASALWSGRSGSRYRVPGIRRERRKLPVPTTFGPLRLALPLAVGPPICGELVSQRCARQ